eukprot:scaffold5386_cov98-Isochrysis_galbana.AAC.10
MQARLPSRLCVPARPPPPTGACCHQRATSARRLLAHGLLHLLVLHLIQLEVCLSFASLSERLARLETRLEGLGQGGRRGVREEPRRAQVRVERLAARTGGRCACTASGARAPRPACSAVQRIAGGVARRGRRWEGEGRERWAFVRRGRAGRFGRHTLAFRVGGCGRGACARGARRFRGSILSVSVGGRGWRGRLAAGGDAGAGVPTLSTTGEVAVAVLRLTLSPGKRPEAPKHSPGPHLGWVRRGSGSPRPARGGRIPAETSRSLSPSRPRQAGVPADGDGLHVQVGGVVVVG